MKNHYCTGPMSGGMPAQLNENAIRILSKRYLRRDPHGEVSESPSQMFERVARNVASAEASYGGARTAETIAREFFELMNSLEFLPNSPTLMNAGLDLQQLSACFVLPLEDSLNSIFEAVKNAALIHRSGGGTGFSFSRIRPKGDRVRSTHGISSGPVSFIQVFDAATDAVKQGGTRRGANMGVLRVDHPDILEFVDAKSAGGLRNFNLSVAITDAFMEAVEEDTCYVLIHPRDGRPMGHMRAADVFSRICHRAWECGEPGIIFIDTINRSNPTPHLGGIECTNPCGEQPLLPYESCVLGSINLARLTAPGKGRASIDYRRLAAVVRTAVQFLDDVIDVNEYPLPAVADISRTNRKIGLGVMGWSDLLIKLGIPYDSGQALALAEKVMGFIRRTGHRASIDLARQRGACPGLAGCGAGVSGIRRNATVTTIAPTGTISLIAGCSSGIEPPFALSHQRRHILEGAHLSEVHPLLPADLAALSLDQRHALREIMKSGSVRQISGIPEEIRRLYTTALEIAPEWHVRMQASFQKHCDNGVSKTVNLAFGSTRRDVELVFKLAHKLGCKGITVYRDRSRETQVLNVGCAACA